jgi:pyridoxal phosphate enzyme (YggS family)
MHKIIVNLEGIKDKLKKFRSNQDKLPEIIAVSKTFTANEIMPLVEYGHLHFGENKIQEALQKWPKIKENFSNIKLHMLGKIQSNKVKYLLPVFDYLHSLDSIKVAEKISLEEEKKNKKLKIFIQINIGNEFQKGGINIDDLNDFYLTCTKRFNLNIVGLMCLPPSLKDPKKYFMLLNDVSKKFNLKDLSMGMSNDYMEAAECGASYLRIGSKIFGERV